MTFRSTILAVAAIFFLFSCGSGNAPAALAAPTTADSLFGLKAKFKHRDLQEFVVDPTELEYYERVDSNTFKLIFQEGNRSYDPDGSSIDYYHSWQNRDSSFIEFTIISYDESNYCTIIRYYVFDRSGKFISKVDLAAHCGDGGWWFEQKGRQVDKTNFATVSVEAESDLGETVEKVEGDTTRHAIQLLPSGLFSQKQLSKKHFVQVTPDAAPAKADSSASIPATADSTTHEP